MSEVEKPESTRAHGLQHYVSWAAAVLVVAGLGLTLWLLPHPALQTPGDDLADGAVVVTENGTIRIRPGTPFHARLVLSKALAAETDQPLIEVTGTVLAAVPPGRPGREASWQLANAELVTTYSEWAQSYADVNFHRGQLATIKDLAQTRIRTQGEVVARLERLVEVGSDAPRDLALQRADLLERKLEADSQTHEEEASLLSAERRHDALERQLEQAGLSPDLLRDAVPGRSLLVAEVPETRITGIREGQRCSVRFYADPETHRSGYVTRILPTVSAAQRTLRVLVTLDTPGEGVRPGMFADVGVGTDKRQSVRIPAQAVVHIGHEDLVLMQGAPDEYRVVSIAPGASDANGIEVVSGVKPGDAVLADGVVLLKPVIADIVHAGAPL